MPTSITVPGYTTQQNQELNTSSSDALLNSTNLSPTAKNFLKGGLLGVITGGRGFADWLLIIMGGFVILIGIVFMFVSTSTGKTVAKTAVKVATAAAK